MKTILALVVLLSTACAMANAQAAPAATVGPANFSYSARYSQIARFFDSGQGQELSSAISGNVDYSNGGERMPFTVGLGGGYMWNEVGEQSGQGFFENLLLSQGIDWRKTRAGISDNLSDRPGTPTTGFSGVTGTGEPIGGSGPPETSEPVLALNTRIINNALSGSISQALGIATNVVAGGGWSILRFPDGNGLEMDTENATATISRRLNALNSLLGTYTFMYVTYPDSSFTFSANTLGFGANRRWNRRWTTLVSVGPQWVSSSDSTVAPSSLRISGSATIDYAFRFGAANLDYLHSVNGGGGFLAGAESDLIQAGATRAFGRTLTFGLDGSYRRLAALGQGGGVTNAKIGAVQATWHPTRSIFATAGYTLEGQSSSAALPTNALSSTVQTINLSIGYTHQPKTIIGP